MYINYIYKKNYIYNYYDYWVLIKLLLSKMTIIIISSSLNGLKYQYFLQKSNLLYKINKTC